MVLCHKNFLLHDLCETHGFVNARYCKSQILHHWTHHTVRISWWHNQRRTDNEEGSVHCSTISCIALVGSISIAYRLSNPFTFVASLENFWPKASDKLWAGSVDYRDIIQWLIPRLSFLVESRTINRTDSRTLASWMAREQDVVVFPSMVWCHSKCQMERVTYLHHPCHLTKYVCVMYRTNRQ